MTSRAADSPPMVERPGIDIDTRRSTGGMPLLRTNRCFAGVTRSSSRCAGVSALTGRSLRTISPSLPGISNGVSDCASAAGIRPRGIRCANGIAAPSTADIASESAFRQESAPRHRVGLAAPKQLVGGNGVFLVELVNATFLVCHWLAPSGPYGQAVLSGERRLTAPTSTAENRPTPSGLRPMCFEAFDARAQADRRHRDGEADLRDFLGVMMVFQVLGSRTPNAGSPMSPIVRSRLMPAKPMTNSGTIVYHLGGSPPSVDLR